MPVAETFSMTESPTTLTLVESDLDGEAHIQVPPDKSGAAVKSA